METPDCRRKFCRALTAQMAVNAENLRVLEAQNATIKTRNTKFRAIIGGTPNNVTLESSQRFIEIEALIQRIIGVPTLIKESTTKIFTDSLFIDAIALVEMSKKFSFPNMKQFEGMTDPSDHIA
ncbi:hypothetical protein Ddye_000425 [Dipteronia dyeriana]|uniref:Uncharacterized protein n=1 Tax=Dipteronia dyeriana TaxID=168575 RepID=A0AAD9XM51_9ROSI|nr:hypothetical protein Ddye_000425 [Dipteronia dyeriana]